MRPKIKSKALKKTIAYLGMSAGVIGAGASLALSYHTKLGILTLTISCTLFITSAIYDERISEK